MKFSTTVLGLVASLIVIATSLPAQAVQLRDGSILVGEIQDPDGEGFTLLRTDNGGILKLRWSHLSQSSAKLIKTGYGLLDQENEEILVRADVLIYENSSGRKVEAVGRISKQDAQFLYVRKRGNFTPVPRKRIRGKSQRQVPPNEIFTTDEYYNDLLAAHTPGEDADKHIELGNLLMRVRDYDHAQQHLDKASSLGGGRQPHVLAEQIKRLQFFKTAREEQGILDAIRTNTNRGQFTMAAKKIAEFKEKFADSKLIGDLGKLERRYREVRKKKLVWDVTRLWYKYVGIFGQRKAAESKLTLAMAKQYAERAMGKEIRAQIAGSLEIETDEVERLWSERTKVKGATQGQRYYFSVGSWLLGPQAVIKDTKQGKVEAAAKASAQSENDKKVAEGVKRIQEALKRNRERMRRRASQGKQGEKKEVTPEDWWAQADRHARTTWLKAYYAEFSGDMVIVGAYVSPCTNCAASGKVASTASVGASQFQDCPVCRATRFRRDIRAK